MAICCRILIPLCVLATIASTLRVYPHQLAYFNEAAGGPENGYKHLLHSNLDWGQDLLLVREWMNSCKLDASCVEFVSYFPHPMVNLIISSSQVGKNSDWIVLSVTKLSHQSDLRGFTDELGFVKIGYGLWAIPGDELSKRN